MKYWFVALLLVVGIWCVLKNHGSHEVAAEIRIYRGDQSNRSRLKRFQHDFEMALQTPTDMQWVRKLYTDGLMCHISYTEFGPSFMAFVELHQALYEYMEDFVPQIIPVPHNIRMAFDEASTKFSAYVQELESITDIDNYEKQLNLVYRNFLVRFMQDYHSFFEERLHHNVAEISPQKGIALDVIDSGFFACRDGWPGRDAPLNKFQNEQLHAYRCDNGNILILGYNTHEYTCSPRLNIYVWDIKQSDSKPVKIPIPQYELGADFELSPEAREGGCGKFNAIEDFVQFDGRYLKFAGYDYMVYRNAVFDTTLNHWEFTSKPAK